MARAVLEPLEVSMSHDAAQVDARVAAATAAVAQYEAGSDEHRAALVVPAAALAARYVNGGAADDGLRAEEIERGVLAGGAATADQRQAMSMLLPTLAMVRLSPATALRGLGPGGDAEALRRTEQWRADTEPGTLAAGLDEVLGQFAAIEDTESLPPQIRSTIEMMKARWGCCPTLRGRSGRAPSLRRSPPSCARPSRTRRPACPAPSCCAASWSGWRGSTAPTSVGSGWRSWRRRSQRARRSGGRPPGHCARAAGTLPCTPARLGRPRPHWAVSGRARGSQGTPDGYARL